MRAQQRRSRIAAAIVATFIVGALAYAVTSQMLYREAVRNLNIALKDNHDTTFDVGAQVQQLPGSKPILVKVFEGNIRRLAQIHSPEADQERLYTTEYAGDMALGIDDISDATSLYNEANQLALQLNASERTPASAWDLAASYKELGDLAQAQNNGAAALANYTKGQKLLLANLSAIKEPKFRHDLAVSYQDIGDINLGGGDSAGALTNYQADLSYSEQAATNTTDPDLTRQLGTAYIKLGTAQLAISQAQQAAQSYQSAVQVLQQTALTDPERNLQRDLAAGYVGLGDADVALNNPGGAADSYNQGLAIYSRLAQDTTDLESQDDLAAVDYKVANVNMVQGKMKDALAWFTKSLGITKQELALNPSDTRAQGNLAAAQQMVQTLQRAANGA
jgi:hypothetical protein